MQRESFRRRHVYTQVALNRYAFTHTRLYALIRLRSAVTYKFFCAEILLSACTFTQTYFDTHTHTDKSFTHKYFCTVMFFRYRCCLTHARTHALSQGCLSTRMLVHRDIFTQKYFYAEIFLHGDAFTHRDSFALRNFAHRCRYKQRCFYKGGIYTRSFYIRTFLHRHTFT